MFCCETQNFELILIVCNTLNFFLMEKISRTWRTAMTIMNLLSSTWVLWKVLGLDHRWQHYRQDFFFPPNWLTTPINAHKCINVPYVVNIILFLHVSATLVAVVKEVHYKAWIYLDTADVCEPMHGFKMIGLKTTWFIP